jgi:uncharacterized membrane protein YqjE
MATSAALLQILSLLGSPSPRPRRPSLGEAYGLLGDSLDHRAQLASLELAEARDHLVVSAVIAAGTIGLALVTGFAVTLLVAGLVWDSPNRGWWLGGLAALYLLGTVGTGLALRRRLKTWRPLSETAFQLQQDQTCLRNLIKTALH